MSIKKISKLHSSLSDFFFFCGAISYALSGSFIKKKDEKYAVTGANAQQYIVKLIAWKWIVMGEGVRMYDNKNSFIFNVFHGDAKTTTTVYGILQ